MFSGIARGRLLDDRSLTQIVEAVDLPHDGGTVLDAGGDDFMRGWLSVTRPGAAYAFGDPAEDPQARYDAVFALEVPLATAGAAQAIAGHLNALGRYALTVLSLEPGHERRVGDALTLLRTHATVTQVEHLTPAVQDSAARIASRHVLDAVGAAPNGGGGLDPARVLHAIDRGAFGYTLIVGTRRADS